MTSSVNAAIQSFIEEEKLPPDYADTVEKWFMPVVEQLLLKISVSQETLVVGITGCQGSGKSTLASLLVILLKELIGINGINLSLDDFYLTHAERQALSRSIHSLFASRGVPGTHDIDLAVQTIDALKKNGPVAIPRFNKAMDDRQDKSGWLPVQGPVDVIILEGWCLSIDPQEDSELLEPVNELEKNEDENAIWRRYVNEKIKQEYYRLYDLIDYLIMLKAPSFEKVFEWRQTQEDKLASRQKDSGDTKIMNKAELKRFIQHYERLTRHGLRTLPAKADVVFQLSDEQTILGKI